MKSLAVTKPNSMEIVETPAPVPGEYDVLVKSEAAFICNATDRKIIEGHFPGIPESAYPVLLGHENVGTVVELGRKVASYALGDRVVGGLVLNPPGGQYGSAWGGNSEYVIATDHEAMVRDGVADAAHGWNEIFQIMKKVPDDITVEAAGLLCTWREVYGGFSDFRLTRGDNILVFGAGPVGQSFVKFARLLDLGWIGSVDPLPAKRRMAREMGADEVFSPEDEALAELVKRRGGGLDAVIDAVGHESIINQAIPLVRMAGAVCVYGVVGAPKITIDKDRGPYNFNLLIHQWPTRTAESAAHDILIGWIRDGKLSHEPFVSGVYPVRDYDSAFAATRSESAVKTMITFDRW